MMQTWKFPLLMSAITTFAVTFVLVSVNYGFEEHFFYIWMRSWAIAATMVAFSIRFVGPLIRKKLES